MLYSMCVTHYIGIVRHWLSVDKRTCWMGLVTPHRHRDTISFPYGACETHDADTLALASQLAQISPKYIKSFKKQQFLSLLFSRGPLSLC